MTHSVEIMSMFYSRHPAGMRLSISLRFAHTLLRSGNQEKQRPLQSPDRLSEWETETELRKQSRERAFEPTTQRWRTQIQTDSCSALPTSLGSKDGISKFSVFAPPQSTKRK